PEFMESITDLEKVQRKIHEWERSREVGTWYDRIQAVNERPPQPPRGELFMRLVSTINEGHFEYRHSLKQDWIPVREKQDLEHLENLHERAAVRMDAQTELSLLSDYARAEDALTLTWTRKPPRPDEQTFHQPAPKATW
ncbi:MAG: ATP-dependent helicase, partial [Akkermansia muciniphila]